MKKILFLIILILITSVAWFFYAFWGFVFSPDSNVNLEPVKVVDWEHQVLVSNLNVPWDFAFLPDGNILLTERGGVIKYFNRSNDELETIASLQNVTEFGEGGLLGIALHPNFSTDPRVYLFYTYLNGGKYFNRVSSFSFDQNDKSLSSEEIIIDRIPAGRVHNGGRILFDQNNKLWIATGDAGSEASAQDPTNLAGKILRLNDDGSLPNDNPFSGSPVFSLGHRNPQGLAFHPDSRELFVSEHGSSAYDEINVIKRGGNYAWPAEKRCFSVNAQFVNPLACSEKDTWAPSGIAFWQTEKETHLLVSNLRGQQVIDFLLENPNKISETTFLFKNEFGRIRHVYPRDDGFYLITSNRDGRGSAGPEDDRLIFVKKVVRDIIEE